MSTPRKSLYVHSINYRTVRNTVIHPLFIENAKFLLADPYITRDNLFIIFKENSNYLFKLWLSKLNNILSPQIIIFWSIFFSFLTVQITGQYFLNAEFFFFTLTTSNFAKRKIFDIYEYYEVKNINGQKFCEFDKYYSYV